jgi:hypothetical protein
MAGTVVTFYSYKGGVGRSFAMVNAAVILAQWGYRVLAVDWDIEAPGLHHYFAPHAGELSAGVLDFLEDCKRNAPRPWDHYARPMAVPDCGDNLHLMPAAATGGADYTAAVQALDWDKLYGEHEFGARLEILRAEWTKNFDLVLIDSRTGVTDFSGITTAQLPDILAFLFTANEQSLRGCCDIARRAMEARRNLPVDRPALIPLPIAAKFEQREEYDRAKEWRARFAGELAPFFRVWMPQSVDASRLVDILTIPYVPRWTFGEDLAAIIEPRDERGTRTASGAAISYSLESLAALLANRLEKVDLLCSSRDEYVLTARAGVPARGYTGSQPIGVYISASGKHRDVASQIGQLLKRRLDLRFYLPSATVTPGSSMVQAIDEELARADALLVIVGPEGLASGWQSEEIDRFLRQSLRSDMRKPLIPIVLAGGTDVLAGSMLADFSAIVIEPGRPLDELIGPVIARLSSARQQEAEAARASQGQPKPAAALFPGRSERRTFRIFLSSASDTINERLRADSIIERLAHDYARFLTIESFRWEHEPMMASGHFQDVVSRPSEFDLFILIVWSSLGTQLPQRTSLRDYRGADGRPLSGLEWEFEDALAGARERGTPDILAFRNIGPISIDLADRDARMSQVQAVEGFWERHFVSGGVFRAGFRTYRSLDEFADQLERPLRLLIERRMDLSASAAPTALFARSPYRGLASYEVEDAPAFFGRDALIVRAVEMLSANARSGTAFLLAFGSSGSGKSSLIKAGVLPSLMRPQRFPEIAFLRRAVFRPSEGRSPFHAFAQCLAAGSADGRVGLPELLEGSGEVDRLADHLRHLAADPSLLFAGALGLVTERARAAGQIQPYEQARLIVFVDQLEELFTQCDRADRDQFAGFLAALARSGTVWVIAALRSDFWNQVQQTRGLLDLAQYRLDVPALTHDEAREMIRKSAAAAGLSFETDPQTGIRLDDMLAEDAARSAGVLPLLSFTLDYLARQSLAQRSNALSLADYHAIGGISGAIAMEADRTVAALPPEMQAALPRVFRRLISFQPDQEPQRALAPLEQFDAQSRQVIDALVKARLLVISGDGRAAAVALAHDALIRSWPVARRIIEENSELLRLRASIERNAADWEREGHDRDYLLPAGRRIAEAQDLLRQWGDELSPHIRHFIEASIQANAALSLRSWLLRIWKK